MQAGFEPAGGTYAEWMALRRGARAWGSVVPLAVVRQVLVDACANADAASGIADRAPSLASSEWLDAATRRGASLAHGVGSGCAATAVGDHGEPLQVLARLEG